MPLWLPLGLIIMMTIAAHHWHQWMQAFVSALKCLRINTATILGRGRKQMHIYSLMAVY